MYPLIQDLYPICRSITGDGVRETLRILQQYIPLTIREVPTGTKVFDWEVPREWNIRDAYVKDPKGDKVIDFQQSNLHVLNYSVPVRGTFDLDTLKSHLFTLPDQPDLIPYRTSYYQENWGFCLSHRVFEQLEPGEYEVVIDSSLEPGHLTYGECVIPGESEEEVMFSSHVCHPSLCNDNLSGIAVTALLAQRLLAMPQRKFTYRFIYAPGTIGAITWLAQNEDRAPMVKHGLIASLLGAPGSYVYKKSRRADTEIDQIVQYVLKNTGWAFEVDDFIPYGYDERQYCSPGFNMPVGNISRARWGQFPEYHTSADNPDFVQPEILEESLTLLEKIVQVLESNRYYLNLNPRCEPQLGRRGLFDQISGSNMNKKTYTLALLWVLNLSDGTHSLLDIAQRSGIEYALIAEVAATLQAHELLQ